MESKAGRKEGGFRVVAQARKGGGGARMTCMAQGHLSAALAVLHTGLRCTPYIQWGAAAAWLPMVTSVASGSQAVAGW